MKLQTFYLTFSKKALIKKKLQIKNTQIFYCLQIFFIKASLLDLNLGSNNFSLFYQVFICNIYKLFQLHYF